MYIVTYLCQYWICDIIHPKEFEYGKNKDFQCSATAIQ